MEGFDRALGASGVIGNAVRVMRIATGEEADHVQDDGKSSRIEGREEARPRT